MKKLSLSLLFVVLAAAIGLGWTLDNLFAQLNLSVPKEAVTSEFSAYRQLGAALAGTLDKQQDATQFVEAWSSNDNLQLSLIALKELPLPEALQVDFLRGTPLELESEKRISIHFLLPHRKQILILSFPKPLETNNQGLRLLFTSLFYIGVLSLVLVWLYPLIRHLQQLRRTAQAFGEGSLEQRVTIRRTSYIADIEIEFNRMAQRIQTLVDDNKLLGNAVSHDLRTPLARLRFGIEALQQTDNPANRDKYQKHISRDIDEMEKLVAVLLNYARMEQAMVKVEQYAVEVNSLVSQCVALHDITDKDLDQLKHIAWSPVDKVYIKGDEHYLAMLVNNLLDNALQHAKKRVNIALETDNKHLSLIVSDDGQGIARDQRAALLKPFTRGKQRQLNQSGYGMGLAIVTRIAQWHNASLSIDDCAHLGGAKFTLVFDLAQ
jgi:two-component system OmpR family sensor kinase